MPGPSGPYTPPPPPRPVSPPPPGRAQAVITFRVGRGVPIPKRPRSLTFRLLTGPVLFGAILAGAMAVLGIAT